MMSIVGLLSGVYYSTQAFTNLNFLGTGGWFHDVEEPRFLGHYMLWFVCAPAQWIIFSRLCTRATPLDIARVVIPTKAIMLLGLSASAGNGTSMGGILVAY